MWQFLPGRGGGLEWGRVGAPVPRPRVSAGLPLCVFNKSIVSNFPFCVNLIKQRALTFFLSKFINTEEGKYFQTFKLKHYLVFKMILYKSPRIVVVIVMYHEFHIFHFILNNADLLVYSMDLFK